MSVVEWRPDDLTHLELEMLTGADSGTPVIREGPTAPDAMQAWGTDRSIRAGVLRHLLYAPHWPVSPKGIVLHGVRIVGDLDLEYLTLRCPMRLENCYLDGAQGVKLSYATASLLELTDCLLTGLTGELLVVTKELDLSRSTFTGPLRLRGADIAGRLDCRESLLAGMTPDGEVLTADLMRVGHDVILDRLSASGIIRVHGADIAGTLSCCDAQVGSRGEHSLAARRIKVGGDILLDRSLFAGELNLDHATIGGDLRAASTALQSAPTSPALSADLSTVAGSVSFYQLSADCTVSLRRSVIRGNLAIAAAAIRSADVALDATGVTVDGSVSVDAAQLDGAVHLEQGHIGARLELTSSQLISRSGVPAVTAAALSVTGPAIFRAVSIIGIVDLSGAQMSTLAIGATELDYPDAGPAAAGDADCVLSVIGSTFSKDVIIRDTEASKILDFTASRITGQLLVTVAGEGGDADRAPLRIKLDRAEIGELTVPDGWITGNAGITLGASTAKPKGSEPARQSRDPAPASRDRIVPAVVIAGSTAAAASLVAVLTVQVARGLELSTWFFVLVGVAIVAMAAVYVSIISSWAPRVARRPRPAAGSRSGSQKKEVTSIAAAIASPSVVASISQSLAARLVTGDLRNYSGVISIAVITAGQPAPPGPEGEFAIGAAEPITITLTLDATPEPKAYAQPISITDGIDSPIVDFRIILSVEDAAGRAVLGARETVSVTPGGSPRKISVEASAPSAPGVYPLTAEVLQENRLVHVSRARLHVTPAGHEP